ncbi:hypothetical protein ScPMuIL_013761 [Solemya velum]
MARNLMLGGKDLGETWDFVLDGGLLSSVRSSLVTELLKYLMYERQQIPLPYENIRHELERACGSAETESEPEEFSRKNMKRSGFYSNLELKRSTDVVKNVEEIASKLQQSFEVCPEIHQVLLLFGGTLVSPKESYLLNLPPLQTGADSLSLKTCRKSIFRKLIMQDVLGRMDSVSPTNLILLVKAPRECDLKWFLPKPSYKVPKRGKHFTFNFVCKSSDEDGMDLSQAEEYLDMSGIAPFESIDANMSVSNDTIMDDIVHGNLHNSHSIYDKTESPRNNGVSKHYSSEMIPGQNGEQEFIWFQSPIVIKGYRDTSSKEASSDIFL